MKILFVIHGYPPLYNAGSEIYTQTIAHGFADLGHEIHVFSREENPFKPSFEIKERQEMTNLQNLVYQYAINVAQLRDRYVSLGVNKKFREIMRKLQPEIVHFNHLNHLSISLVSVASEFNIPIFFTLHDYWLACPRGQFIQMNYSENVVARVCDGQEDKKCAIHCYSRYFTGTSRDHDFNVNYWTEWVHIRQKLVHEIVNQVDLFIAPSLTILNRMISELNIQKSKITYLDYGFDYNRFQGRKRRRQESVVFGYIGTHILTKGIHLLLEAFSKLDSRAELKIWGRSRSETTPYLKQFVEELKLHNHLTLKWLHEYTNQDIISQVFNEIDILVVPSIWDENSPLVIHEALQARVPVITASHGGMSEYVKHNVNGRLFTFRDVNSLVNEMQFFLDNPDRIDELGSRGYLLTENGDVISQAEHLQALYERYQQFMNKEN